MNSAYEIALLGNVSVDDKNRLTQTINERIQDFHLRLGSDVILHDGASVGGRDIKAAFAAAYFGGASQPDLAQTAALVDAKMPVIPTIDEHGDFGTDLPDILKMANGQRRRDDDPDMIELATALLECVGLLRRQRRVFVSYRRTESRAAAMQMHDLMSTRGFDVFLDTHEIRPGEIFQDELWHHLCDSDVLIMLDTATYFDSMWTKHEVARALAKEIQVLRVVWPSVTPSRLTSISTTRYLDAADMLSSDGPLSTSVADELVLTVESLRSRSIASRYLSITGKLSAEVSRIGTVLGVGAHRAISVQMFDDKTYSMYPIVGIPTAELLWDVAEKSRNANQTGTPLLVYDQVGIRDRWINHLRWLDEHIKTVRAVRIDGFGWNLVGLED